MLAYGKKEGEWRGEGILYHTSLGLHHHTTIHRHAISTTIKSPHTGHKTRLVAAHLPHHATLDVALQLLEEWGRTMPKGRAILGIDANETFYGGGPQGNRHTLPEARKGLGVAPARPSAGHPDLPPLQHGHAA